MSKSDKIRKLLDERGVKYDEVNEYITYAYTSDRAITYYAYDYDSGISACVDYPRPRLNATEWLTPEQAIAATLGSDGEYEAKMDALLCRLTNGKWSKSRAYDLDFMVSCVDEEYEDAYEKERAELGSGRLTVGQVQEAIERHFGKVAVLDDGGPVEWRDDWVCKVGIDYRGITDELNATLDASLLLARGTLDIAARHAVEQDERTAALEANWNAAKASASRWRERCVEYESRCYELESLVKDMWYCSCFDKTAKSVIDERIRQLGIEVDYE